MILSGAGSDEWNRGFRRDEEQQEETDVVWCGIGLKPEAESQRSFHKS